MSGGVTHVTLYSDAAYYGGAEVYLSMIVRNLDRSRFRLSALLPDEPPLARLEEDLRAAGATLLRHPRPGFGWLRALPSLRRALRSLGGDVLHINLPSTYDAGLSCVAAAGRMAGYRRVVTTEHLPMIARRYRRFPVKAAFSEAVDAIIVPAVATREHVVRVHYMPQEKTRVIPYGIEDPPPVDPSVEEDLRARTGCPRGTVILGIVGTLHARKGHAFLFEALDILRGRGELPPSVRVWVIGGGGDPGDRESHERMIRERRLEDRVRMIGPRSDAASLMRLLDVLVVPSLMETTPFVIIEAMAAARPVVASRIYGIPEMIEDGQSGFLTRPGDAADVARGLMPLLGDRALRKRFGRRGRERFESTFAAGKMARATEEVYLGREPHENGGRPR